MGNVGRFFCVALPFILCVGSFIFLLIACLAGVTNKDLYMFRVNTTNLSINPASLSSILNTRALDASGWHDIRQLSAAAGDAKTNNITAGDLDLAYVYDISVWGYCSTDKAGNKACTQPKLDWAASALNTTFIEDFGAVAGRKIDLPDEITSSLNAFKLATKWTQIVFIIAFVALGLEIILGIFANCTRIMSCVTFIVAGIATTAVSAAAALSTAMSVIVVGAVEGTAKFYGVSGGFNTTFLALVWIAAALAIAAGFFWMFTICCCAPDHRRKDRKRHSDDGEKLLGTSAYQPLHEPNNGYYNNNQQQQQYGAPRYPSGARSDLAYEPYSHRG